MDQMVSEHEMILSTLDEPLADGSYIPTFILCRLVKKHVTVALSGDGGDELFAGYPTFIADRWARRLDLLPEPLIRALRKLVSLLPVSMNNLTVDFMAKQFFKGMIYPHLVRNQVWLGAFTGQESQSLLLAPYRDRSQHAYDLIHENFDAAMRKRMDPGQLLQQFYERFYLQGDILVKTDRASMANALEVRSPLLDDDLAAFSRKIPFSMKLRGRETKYLYKKAMEGRLPHEIIYRKKKGFGMPISQWIRQDLKSNFEETLSDQNIRRDGIFNSTRVRELLREHLTGKKDNRKPLWTLYVFQKWKENLGA
jgi:asparagine synthase (glutamine-hydrolysing)